MKGKTIKAVIAKKMEDWFKSIEDESIRLLARKNVFVTGGCIASMLLREKVNDFDVYFRTKEAALAIANYYVPRFTIKKRNGIECGISVVEDGERIKIVVKSGGEYVSEVMQDPGAIQDASEDLKEASNDVSDGGYRPVFMSTNAITLSGKVQIVLRFYGEPEEVHKNYDFVHCTNYWTSWDRDLVLHKDALESLLARELRYVGSKYPICSVFRLRKFIGRGWTVNAGQILKMAFQISELDLHDMKVLEDQLTGVDVAYFVELIDKLKEKDPAKVNAAYLVEILDRMF